MKKWLRIILVFVLLISMTGCRKTLKSPETFDDFTKELWTSMYTDYLDIKFSFEHPENFGIDMEDVEVSLGEFDYSLEGLKETREELQTDLKTLTSYDYEQLSSEQKATYDYLKFVLSGSIELNQDQYQYMNNVFDGVSGVHTNLITYFSEFPLSNEQEVEEIIQLLEQTPDYLQQYIDYAFDQAKAGYLMIDIDSVIETCQTVVDAQEKGGILKSLYEQVDLLELSDPSLKDRLKEAYMTYFLKGYQNVIDAMEELRSYPNNEYGLAHMKNGRAYYHALVRYQVGTELSIKEIKKMMTQELEACFNEIIAIQTKYPEVMDRVYQTGFEDYHDMIDELAILIQDDFPQVNDLSYQATPIDEDLANENTAAYFLIPKIDADDLKTIRVNTTTAGFDLQGISTFTTIAHEGYPGHMYQTAYVYENISDLIRKTGQINGYTEGYATYVEKIAYQYLKEMGINQHYLDYEYYNDRYISCIYILSAIGIHDEDWDKETLKSFFNEHYLVSDDEVIDAVYSQLRDCAGYFESYYVGVVLFNQLRDKAEKALGDRFNEKDFHEAILKLGSVPFASVERSVDEYIQDHQ